MTWRERAGKTLQRAGRWMTAVPPRVFSAGGWGGFGAFVSEEQALDVPPFGRGVRLLASLVAQCDLHDFRTDPTTGVETRVLPGAPILDQPDIRYTPWEWKWGVVEDLIEYGNHLSVITELDDAGWPRHVAALDITQCSVMVLDGTWPMYVVGDGRILDPSQVLHIRAGNRSGMLVGRGVLSQHAWSLGTITTTERWAGDYFRAGGSPGGIVKVDSPDIQEGEMTEIRAKVDALLSGGARYLIFNQVTSWQALASDADKAQLVEARNFNAINVANILDLPPELLGASPPGGSMTYANIESRWIDVVRSSVTRWTSPIESSMSGLLPNRRRTRFALERLQLADAKTRAEVSTMYVGAGILTPNEVRLADPFLPDSPIDAAPAPPELQEVAT